jgi:hypothetical protein
MTAKAKKNPTWLEAIERVLRDNGKAMHYRDITQAIIDSGHQKNSANPAISVQIALSTSLKDPNTTPFVRRGGGMYDLKAGVTATQTTSMAALPVEEAVEPLASIVVIEAPLDGSDIEAAVEADLAGPIRAYAMYWSRADVHWAAKPNLFGEQVKGARQVNFTEQAGVYILHDGTRVIYVGQAGVDGNLGARLYAHTRNRLSGRWDRFSWFGVRGVNDNGTLEDMPQGGIDVTSFIGALEAVLIEALEPPQNRRAGEGFTEDIEWQQKEDPAIERKRKKAFFDDIQRQLG